MGNEVAAALRGASREVGADELTQGLLLVRASAIKVVRLQLAMERRDRRVALEAVDDLVILDRKIEDFLSGMPGSSQSLSALEAELEAQRQALTREKFTLAAGTVRRGRPEDDKVSNIHGGAVEGLAADGELVLAFPVNGAPIAPRPADNFIAARASRLLAVCLVLALLALAAAAFFFLADSGTPFARGA